LFNLFAIRFEVVQVVWIALGCLVLLILGHEVEQIRVGVRKFVLFHALGGEPVEEGFPLEHEAELRGGAFENLVNDGVVAEESSRDIHVLGRHVAYRRLYVVRQPIDEVRAVFRLNVQNLVVNLAHRQLASEDYCHGQIPKSNLKSF
jgi:hypothetical protein